MRRHIDFAQDGRKVLAFLIISLWLIGPFNLAPADPDFFDGFEREESSETPTINPGAAMHRATRQSSLQAPSPTALGAAMLAIALLSARTSPSISTQKPLKIYRLTEAYRI